MSDQDYEVGYGKPPTHSQFKKGQSGNPKGRPKGSQNLASRLEKQLKTKMAVTVDGKRQKLEVFDVIIYKMIQNAMQGNTLDQLRLLQKIEELTPHLLKEEAERTTKIMFRFGDQDDELSEATEAERQELRQFLELRRRGIDVPLDPLDF